MPFPFDLPTTGAVSLSAHIRCDSHPSLILAATTGRNVLRTALKSFKRSAPSSRSAALGMILSALEEYIPYLLTLECGLSGNRVAGEEIHVTLVDEIEVEWRPCLVPGIAGRPVKRFKGKGLDFEICFVLATMAHVSTLLARNKLHTLYVEPSTATEQRIAAFKAANQYLCRASALHTYVAQRSADSAVMAGVHEIAMAVQSALAALALAEANLAFVSKDDPYPALVLQSRNKEDTEWMYKAPDIPKVRARLFAHGSLAASELASKAGALLGSAVEEDLVAYVKQLQRVSRAKACRFFGIDAELSGKVGEAIGWLQAAKKELGLKVDEEGKFKAASLTRLKQSWKERREDRKILKGDEWGMDAGQIEESRIVLMLEETWNKSNNMISAQLIPSAGTLTANMPSGRELTHTDAYVPRMLGSETLARMRGPVSARELATAEAASDDESEDEGVPAGTPGTFPAPSTSSRYY